MHVFSIIFDVYRVQRTKRIMTSGGPQEEQFYKNRHSRLGLLLFNRVESFFRSWSDTCGSSPNPEEQANCRTIE